ncbi:hypothetical protein K227x_33620 [Rubripirellula lacrimiformis]|uniref:DUF4154 domain-containing protein n=1 Tax=Rubripirellula lacrimiformis TaxID=1930273 RepID=A0A517NCV0_9BACT|nr:hypothetical protein K227x_33620 [Rubripirellula lacrimiformis]
MIFVCANLGWADVGRAGGQELRARDASLKAAYIYNIAKYTQWPTGFESSRDSSQLVFAVYGDTPVTAYLYKIAAKKRIRERPIAVTVIAAGDALSHDDAAQLRMAHVLFIPASASDRQREHLIQATSGTSTMLFGETLSSHEGDCVTFYIESNRVKFQIDLAKVTGARVQVSSKVLSLGRVVRNIELVHAQE